MKIYINTYGEIVSLNYVEDAELVEKEVDREEVFGDISDFMILHYNYIEDANGFYVVPRIDYNRLIDMDYKNKIDEQSDKISILEAEKDALLESQKVQDRTIVENDMRMMDLEWALEDLIIGLNPTANIKLMEVFDMFGRSTVYFNQLKQMIEMENYDSKEDMERILNKYASGSRPRITKEEYDELFDMLYPPVYDITTEHAEA